VQAFRGPTLRAVISRLEEFFSALTTYAEAYEAFTSARKTADAAPPPRNRWFVDSPLEGDGFELLVPRHKSRGFPQHFGHCGGIGGALKRYHLMAQPLSSCALNHSIDQAGARFELAALRGGFVLLAVQLIYTLALHRLSRAFVLRRLSDACGVTRSRPAGIRNSSRYRPFAEP
jgi:hypothetical protein